MQRAGLQAGVAVKVDTFTSWTEIYIQVAGAAVFYFARSREELEQASAIQAGLAFDQASTKPPFKLTWIGDLWVMPNQSGSAIEITPAVPPATPAG